MDRTEAEAIQLPGGKLCLNFANTTGWHIAAQPEESLTSYSELLAWGRRAGVLKNAEALRLAREAECSPSRGNAALRRAIELREAIFRIFLATARRLRPAAGDLVLLNRTLSEALNRLQIMPSGRGFAWRWNNDKATPELIFWRVASSAAALLMSTELHRVKVCADERCGWLFVDTSRNRSRRWCSMQDCGNRAKARRHYQRTTMA
jgi:predicted RNA-binding Zn ribbon-like protein